MPQIIIETLGCRGCTLCVDVCPTDVLEMDELGEKAIVQKEDDCIGCTSCQYICPSNCIAITDTPLQKPFYRIEENVALIEKFIQDSPAMAILSSEDFEEALIDVHVRLNAICEAVSQTMGRGQKAVGRKAGVLAASHMPELYEGETLEKMIDLMRIRFKNCIEFSGKVEASGEKLCFNFEKCALKKVVEDYGQKPGEAMLCVLFHEYWAGLWGSFTQKKYVTQSSTINSCEFELFTK